MNQTNTKIKTEMSNFIAYSRYFFKSIHRATYRLYIYIYLGSEYARLTIYLINYLNYLPDISPRKYGGESTPMT